MAFLFYTGHMTEITLLINQLAEKLIKQQKRLATAESCTGGWLSKSITDLEGSSQWFDCAIVSYSNQAKVDLLGVQQVTLDLHGAVSQPVVKEMVLGLLERCGANMGVSISGIAGPGGGTPEKPVGTIWIAWARPGVFIEAVKFNFAGDRNRIRLQAVYEALKGFDRLLDQSK
jgi:nicotinamide-nucleotide amidase